jgi:hypothetical protein
LTGISGSKRGKPAFRIRQLAGHSFNGPPV